MQTSSPRLLRLLPFLWVAASLVAAPVSTPDKFAAIPERMQAFVDQGEVSGAVMLVATRDRVLHLSAIGQSDLASSRKMETNDFFWIASMTKPMSSVCVAMLVDEGRLGFDDPV